MSDIMLFGVIRMPYEMAMGCEISRRQYWDRANQAADRIEQLTAQRDAAMKDAERWRLASTSRNFGIANWCEYGQRTSYDAYACQLIDAAIANCKEHK